MKLETWNLELREASRKQPINQVKAFIINGGKWSYKRDSIEVVFSNLNTILEDEEEINDTLIWAINKKDCSLSFFKKINKEKDKKEMTDKFIEEIKLSVRKYDKN